MVMLFFLGSGAFFLRGLYRSLVASDEAVQFPFQVGHGVALISIT